MNENVYERYYYFFGSTTSPVMTNTLVFGIVLETMVTSLCCMSLFFSVSEVPPWLLWLQAVKNNAELRRMEYILFISGNAWAKVNQILLIAYSMRPRPVFTILPFSLKSAASLSMIPLIK